MVDSVQSPCIKVCRIDHATGWCEGCGRSLDEIAAWPRLAPGEQRRLLAELADRRRMKNGDATG